MQGRFNAPNGTLTLKMQDLVRGKPGNAHLNSLQQH